MPYEPKTFSSDHILENYRTQNNIDWSRVEEEINPDIDNEISDESILSETVPNINGIFNCTNEGE